MTPNVRIYASEDGANKADALLAENGFRQRTLLLPSRLSGQEEEAVNAAILDGTLPDRYRQLCIRSLKAGRSLLSARAMFGQGADLVELMETADCVDTDVLQSYRLVEPAPLSVALGIPTVVGFVSSTGLVNSKWTFSSMFGFGLLSRSAAPLSSMFGLGTISAAKRNWTSSFGFSLLSRNPAPLSSMLGMPAVSTGPKKGWRTSFGFPLLSRNPAPLSSLFGITTVVRDRPGKK